MKKYFLGVLLTLLIPFYVSATSTKVNLDSYNKMNLQDSLKAEEITADLSNYKESDDQITIYMFRGQGCVHCEDFLSYVAKTLVPKYGNYFKLVSFETWNDSNNATLLKTVSNFLNENASGVPYIIIGDKTFLGYAESSNTEIENAIMTLYNSKERYDVFNEMNKEEEKTTYKPNTAVVLIGTTIITAIGVSIILIYNANMKKEILTKLEENMSKETKKLKK